MESLGVGLVVGLLETLLGYYPLLTSLGARHSAMRPRPIRSKTRVVTCSSVNDLPHPIDIDNEVNEGNFGSDEGIKEEQTDDITNVENLGREAREKFEPI